MTKRTTGQWEALLAGTTPGPWEVETVPEMRYCDGETWEVPGEIVVSAGEATLFVAADGFVGDEGDEHDNEKNVRLAAAAPELAAEHHRIITALEGWRKEEQEVLATVDPTSLVDQLLIVAAQDNINWITRILEGDSNE